MKHRNRFADRDIFPTPVFAFGCWYEIERKNAPGLWFDVLIIGRRFGTLRVMYPDGRIGLEAIPRLTGFVLLTVDTERTPDE